MVSRVTQRAPGFSGREPRCAAASCLPQEENALGETRASCLAGKLLPGGCKPAVRNRQ